MKLNDIVVFNFPAGDTVALNFQDADFYTLAYNIGKQIYPNPIDMDSLTREQQKTVYDLYYNAGRKEILSNPQRYGKVVTRPVDRRENYVKRCVGLPGDTLQIISGQVMIDGKVVKTRKTCNSTILCKLPVRTSRKKCSANWVSAKPTKD